MVNSEIFSVFIPQISYSDPLGQRLDFLVKATKV